MDTIPGTKVEDVTLLDERPMTPDELVDALRAQSRRYHRLHPFHVLMHEGQLSQRQIQTWVANRFYYQKCIPMKDAAILSNCPDADIRRRWIQRIIDHDGTNQENGGTEAWLRLAEAVGLSREEVLDERHVVPGARFAVDAYVVFARTRPWIDAVASSLTEMFVPELLKDRIAAFERHYIWMDPAGLEYFKRRLTQAHRDSVHALELVRQYCTTRDLQERAIAALMFKCDVLWSLLDAIQYAHVMEEPPGDA